MSIILDISKVDMVFPTPKGDFTALKGVDLQIKKGGNFYLVFFIEHRNEEYLL